MYNSDPFVDFEIFVAGSKEVAFWDEMLLSV